MDINKKRRSIKNKIKIGIVEVVSTLKFEETNSKGRSNQCTVKLEKINKEWKIIDGVW